MPAQADIQKVLVIGSGPIVIGQAAEFDYAGSQACRALREVGKRVVLVNSNPATIMTDPSVADVVYLEPLNVETLQGIIARERPDGLLPTLGGQTGLNLAVDLHDHGILERYGLRLLGTPIEAIRNAEDRMLFRDAMKAAGQPVIKSEPVTSPAEAVEFARTHSLPVVVRPAFTLGGSGGGIARNEGELKEIVSRGLSLSPIRQVLLERTVEGWKEIEYEVLRDHQGSRITVCSMENLDPMGIHTGDSIVVAPTQTLTDSEFQMLRGAALDIIDYLKIEGGCNIQFALDPRSDRYYVIEVNPRLSRSSALASKATGYPIAKVAAKIAVGMNLEEIRNPVTGATSAFFEPALDYVVVKVPQWPFDKFPSADRSLGTQMKATGEAMAIDKGFEGALMKALRSLGSGGLSIRPAACSGLTDAEIRRGLKIATPERLFLVSEALARGVSPDEIAAITGIDPFFIRKIARLVRIDAELRSRSGSPRVPLEAKQAGFSDRAIARATGKTEPEVRRLRTRPGDGRGALLPSYRMVDTCAGEFEARTPYYYSIYGGEDEVTRLGDRTALVIGSGPIRIGQGIEFDYCCVRAALALRNAGYGTIMINNNPETVSTDFDVSDRLYFEPVTFEDVMNIVAREQPLGVLVQFGGQTAINLAGPLAREGVPILGTQAAGINLAEDRKEFDSLLARLGIPRPEGGTASSIEDGVAVARQIGYPVLVRPSYVIAGRAMEIVYDEEQLITYLESAIRVTGEHPVLIDRYVKGREAEVDAVCDGTETLVCGIMEHIEQAGIHSGDSIAAYPPVSLTAPQRDLIVEHTSRIAASLGCRGLINVQFVLDGSSVLVIEANPRASRTIPFMSKSTGLPVVDVAVGASLGRTIREMGYSPGLYPAPRHYSIKAPVFSFGKLKGVETSLGPEMKSTGEVMGISHTYADAMSKALSAAGFDLNRKGSILMSIADRDKPDATGLATGFASLGYGIIATDHTAEWLSGIGIPIQRLDKAVMRGGSDLKRLGMGDVSMAIVTASHGKDPSRWGFSLRRALSEFGIPTVTALSTGYALLAASKASRERRRLGAVAGPVPLNEYLATTARVEQAQSTQVFARDP